MVPTAGARYKWLEYWECLGSEQENYAQLRLLRQRLVVYRANGRFTPQLRRGVCFKESNRTRSDTNFPHVINIIFYQSKVVKAEIYSTYSILLTL